MYAVVKIGGSQYRVAEGDTLQVEKIDAEVGSNVSFDQVLMVGGDKPQVGSPVVSGASIDAEVVSQYKGKKVHIIKFKRRKHHIKRQGHRQLYTKLKVNKINA
jgi:large subunit ribosomal protein L21